MTGHPPPDPFGTQGDIPPLTRPAVPGVPSKRPRRHLLLGTLVAVAALLLGALIGALSLPDDDQEPRPAAAGAGTSPASAPTAPPSSEAPRAPTTSRPAPASTTPAQPGAPEAAGDQAAARKVAQRAMDALNTRNVRMAKRISCEASTVQDDALEDIPEGTHYELGRGATITGERAVVPFTITYRDRSSSDEVHLEREGDSWCVLG